MSTDYTSLCADHSERIAALEDQRETEKACIQDIYERLDRLKVQHESNWARIVKLEEAHQQPDPVDEEENDRRFRACLAAIDNATPEQIRAAVAKASAKPDQQGAAPAGGLVERVAQAMATDSNQPLHASAIAEWSDEARAAILAVAEWLGEFELSGACRVAGRWLREEVER
jgi:hypothetical protein